MENAEHTEDPVLSLIKITLPNNESFDLQVNTLGIVKDIYLILMEREETCHRTCFSLKLNNMADYLDEFKPIRELKNDVVFVEELYNEREAKFHIKHIHDLLRNVQLTDAYLGLDQMSLSFVNIITEGFLLESKYQQTYESLDIEPPEYILPIRGNSVNGPQLTHLHPIEIEIKPNICLKSLNYSNWNPPPSYRVLHGDLVYLYVHTREDKRIHITGCPKGFYVNQSTDQSFNPEKASLLFHSIIDLLKNVSLLFNQNYESLIKRRSNRHPFERIKTPYQIYSWLSPIFEHSLDSIRIEEEFCYEITYEEHLPGKCRDWNNEMQCNRKLPRENMYDCVNRAKSIFKTNSDFVTAVSRAATYVLRCNIMASNPGKCKKKQMFNWNNIFFSLGFDIQDRYRNFGCDAAAYAAKMNIFNVFRIYSHIDNPDYKTVGMAVIDFAGYRVTASTMISGIPEIEYVQFFDRSDYLEKIHVLRSDYFSLLDRIPDELKIIHDLVSKDGKDIMLELSIECRGIIDNDEQFYIHDLLFTSPPDVHYLGGAEDPRRSVGFKVITKDELSLSMARLGYPFAHRHKFSVLRHELLEAFCANKYTQFLRLIESGLNDAKAQKLGDRFTHIIENKSLNNVKIFNETDIFAYDETFIQQIIAKCALDVSSISDSKVVIKFYPDVFKLGVTIPDDEKVIVERRRQLFRDASEFLVDIQIPQLIEDLYKNLPQDGRSLVEAMHGMGINTRYLNRLIETIHHRADVGWLKTLAVSEILIRSTKHLFKPYLQEVDPVNMSSSIAHFLNCLLSSCTNPVSCLETCIFKTPAILWTRIKDEALAYYHYSIDCFDVYSFCCTYEVSRITLLRNFCQSLGIQLYLRDYTFDQKSKQTFNDEDIISIYPLVKHLNPVYGDAYKLFGKSRVYFSEGHFSEGHFSEGHFSEGIYTLIRILNRLNYVYGVLHPETEFLNETLGYYSYKFGEYEAAIKYEHIATMISERVHGIDSTNIIFHYWHLGLYAFALGKFKVALNCTYRARYVALLCHGEIHPNMPKIDTNIGIMLVAEQKYNKALQFLENALEKNKIFYGLQNEKVALCYQLIADINDYNNDIEAAIEAEIECSKIYEKIDPEKNRREESEIRISYWRLKKIPLERQELKKTWSLDKLNLVNCISLIQLNDEELKKIREMNTLSLQNLSLPIEVAI